MSTDEISNRRCRWLLRQRGFRFWQETEIGTVLPLRATNPDFVAETPMGLRFFLELKSFEKDTILDRMDPSIRTFSLGHMTIQRRVNRLVRDAAEQLLPYADAGLPMVVGLDNYRQKGVGLDKHSLRSLFGELVVQIETDSTTGAPLSEAWVHRDDGSPLAGGRNRHVSAILVVIPTERFATLDKDDDFAVERKMKVRIHHNPDALVPLPTNIFSDPADEHFT